MEDAKEKQLEEDYLEETKTLLYDYLSKIKSTLAETKSDVNDMVKQISSDINSLDNADRASLMIDMDKDDFAIFELVAKEMVIKKQTQKPYFGRIDFQGYDEDSPNSYYIGISNLASKKNNIPQICDWRAPISSMYYDFEVGDAFYQAPLGKILGNISRKRQYGITNGKLDYFFDSNMTIGDEILKEALSHSTSMKMKNIVSTIQKEQNAVIRSDINRTLVVQGVAGSGKTSIALHRIAFLLYRYKERIKARNMLILSPNRIFSDYISNVLPELGEQNVMEITFGELAFDELRGICPFEDRSEMTDDVLGGNERRANEINIKASFEFADKLDEFLKQNVGGTFCAEDIVVGDDKIEKEKLQELFSSRYGEKEVSKRIEWIAEYVADELGVSQSAIKGTVKRIKTKLYKMLKDTDILKLYEEFLRSVGLELEFAKSGVLRYEDVSPILYIKDYLLGIQTFKDVKYMLIDEMQDYDPLCLRLVCKMFKCPKTVLGDIYQTFEKSLDEAYLEKFTKVFGDDAMLLKINKSYRSTRQIAEFAQKFIGFSGAENVSRDGKEVEEIVCGSEKEMLLKIKELSDEMEAKKYLRTAIICKTEAESQKVYKLLSKLKVCSLMKKESTAVLSGTIVTTAGLSKGLEFDGVIIPYANEKNYNLPLHKNCLYISCSRALHELYLLKI